MISEQSINTAAFNYYGRLGKVKHFVDEHYAEQVTLKKAAQVACLEEKYFSTYFREKTGMRFVDWVAEVRISHAMDMLRQHDKPISVVCDASGFRDMRTFERAFRKCMDMTPSEFKRSVEPT